MIEPKIDGHIPVLCEAVVEALPPIEEKKWIVVDGTFGLGGHYRVISEALGTRLHQYIGIEYDPFVFEKNQHRFRGDKRLTLVCGTFQNMTAFLSPEIQPHVVLFDLGLNMLQLKSGGRGFSVYEDGPLDMRVNTLEQTKTALDILQDYSVEDLASALSVFSNIRNCNAMAKRLKQFVVAKNVPKTTQALIRFLMPHLPRSASRRVHPATTIFQCLRILVNEELQAIEDGIPMAIRCLSSGGRLMVISFHSAEHRLVKRVLKQHAGCGKIVYRKPVRPKASEVKANPAARSAQLRVFEKV